MGKSLDIILAISRFLVAAVASLVLVHIAALLEFSGPSLSLIWMLIPIGFQPLFPLTAAFATRFPAAALKNALVLLIFSLLSIGLVFLESKAFFQFRFPPSQKTAYFSIPPNLNTRLTKKFFENGVERFKHDH